jgi:hypothetical protein
MTDPDATGPPERTVPRLETFGFLLAFTAFAADGIWMVRDGEVVAGLLVTGFSGLGAPAFLVMLLPGANPLILGGDAFTLSSLFRALRPHRTDTSPFVPAARRSCTTSRPGRLAWASTAS